MNAYHLLAVTALALHLVWITWSILARISDLKIADNGVGDAQRLCSRVNQAQGSRQEVDTQWVRACPKRATGV